MSSKRQPIAALALGDPGPGRPRVLFFPSTQDVGRAGHNRRNVWSCAMGRRNHHHGYAWTYLPRRQAARWRAALAAGQAELELN